MKTSEPSRTAQSVATHLLLLSYDKNWKDLVPPEIIEPTQWFLNHLPGPAKNATKLLERSWVRFYLRLFEKWALPGFGIHLALRKHWIEQKTMDALEHDIKQVVVLGAGFDTLAYRLHKQKKDVVWIEIDHPDTQIYKKEALNQHDHIEENLHFLSADFTKRTLGDMLKQCDAYNPQERTLFITEGLLMYLNEYEVRDLLDEMWKNSGQGSLIAATCMEPLPNGKLAFKEAKWLVNMQPKWVGEPLQWGVSQDGLSRFLKDHSFHLIEDNHSPNIATRLIAHKTPIPKSEYFFLATTDNQQIHNNSLTKELVSGS